MFLRLAKKPTQKRDELVTMRCYLGLNVRNKAVCYATRVKTNLLKCTGLDTGNVRFTVGRFR